LEEELGRRLQIAQLPALINMLNRYQIRLPDSLLIKLNDYIQKEVTKRFQINQNQLYRLISTLLLYPHDKIYNQTICGLVQIYLDEFSRNEKLGYRQNEAKW